MSSSDVSGSQGESSVANTLIAFGERELPPNVHRSLFVGHRAASDGNTHPFGDLPNPFDSIDVCGIASVESAAKRQRLNFRRSFTHRASSHLAHAFDDESDDSDNGFDDIRTSYEQRVARVALHPDPVKSEQVAGSRPPLPPAPRRPPTPVTTSFAVPRVMKPEYREVRGVDEVSGVFGIPIRKRIRSRRVSLELQYALDVPAPSVFWQTSPSRGSPYESSADESPTGNSPMTLLSRAAISLITGRRPITVPGRRVTGPVLSADSPLLYQQQLRKVWTPDSTRSSTRGLGSPFFVPDSCSEDEDVDVVGLSDDDNVIDMPLVSSRNVNVPV